LRLKEIDLSGALDSVFAKTYQKHHIQWIFEKLFQILRNPKKYNFYYFSEKYFLFKKKLFYF